MLVNLTHIGLLQALHFDIVTECYC